MFRRALFALAIISILTVTLSACGSQQQQQTASYDPEKKYAAFLVVNSPQSGSILATAKEKSTIESYEIGPVVYYEPGTKDFEALVKKLTPSKQVSLIWVLGSLFDTPNIQKALTAAGYKGFIRYMPVSGPVTQ
jgi:hypothetical protein